MKGPKLYLSFLLLFISGFCLNEVKATENNFQIVVTGKVTSQAGESLPGVNVLVEGTTTGTTTDLEGKYSLSVPDGKVSLTFSYIGYIKKTVPLEGQTVINMVLDEEISELDEVVVVGYGLVKKKDLTGSVSVIGSGDLKEVKSMSVTDALISKAPGVDINSTSGSPGKLPTIRIRGIGTITDATPLYVVDGMPMDPDAILFLNPVDIESVTVLKDASATAIYGTRGGNGVIMITTKKGQQGAIKVNYSGYYGVQKITDYPDMMLGTDWATLQDNLIRQVEPGDPLYIDPAAMANTDWVDEITRPAPIQSHNLTFSGGNEKSIYLFSLGYYDQKGIIKNTYGKRFNIRINSDHTVTKWLKIGENFIVTKLDNKGVQENWEYGSVYANALLSLRVIEPYDSTGNWNGNPYTDQYENPVFDVDRTSNVFQTYKGLGNAYVEIQPIKGLQFKSTAGYSYENRERDAFYGRYALTNGNTGYTSSLEKEFRKVTSWTWENTLSYGKIFGQHEISVLIGTSAYEYYRNGLSARDNRGPENEDPSLRYFDVYNKDVSFDSVQNYYDIEGPVEIYRLSGLLGRINYSYKNKYLITINYRRDGSSKFGPKNRYGNFPGFAIAWKVHEEAFIKRISVISQLKLRGGWGRIGNDRIGNDRWRATIGTDLGYSFGGQFSPGATALIPANPILAWETTQTTNLGLDLGLFHNKLQMTLDLYSRKTTDMLSNPELNSIFGVSSTNAPYVNVADLENKGYEFTIGYKDLEGKLGYSVGGHISGYKNKVTELGQSGDPLKAGTYGNNTIRNFSYTQIGYPIGTFYGYIVDGIFQNYDEINSHAYQDAKTAPGDYKFRDVNLDGKITPQDMTYMGSPHPDFVYGLFANLTFLNFDLGISLRGVYGNDILVAYRAYAYNFDNGLRNYHVDLLDYWRPDNTDTDIPRYDSKNSNDNNAISTAYLENGSFLRIQNLQVGYSIPSDLVKRINISNVRIYFSAQNLYTFTKYKYGDPDIGPSVQYQVNGMDATQQPTVLSVDYGKVPTPRILSAGLEVTF